MAGIVADCTKQWKHFATQNLVKDEGELVAFGVANYTHSVDLLKEFTARQRDFSHQKSILFGPEWVETAKQ